MKLAMLNRIAASAPAPAIPYRTDAVGFSGTLTTALTVTVVLLALIFLALLWARKKGWLQRWTRTPLRTESEDLRVAARLRLSPATHAYVLRHGEREYLVVESSQRVQVMEHGEGEAGHAD
ncbi:hypothetical protein GCM10027285_26920 [Oleiagrimonas citrea]|uniref:Uncharacterized protein n=1 Tax=Oleiagrimonas citrea TaxID=1665687 RepID=A0A846ZME9_9GAMM|nr:hypothetical protein [Oleiagrimonas citrea]NKZ39032.1 hypothetical protein [Oleiagrimonas citrea]